MFIVVMKMDREMQIRSEQAHKQTRLREVSWKEIKQTCLPSINLSTSQKFDNEHIIHQWKLHCIYIYIYIYIYTYTHNSGESHSYRVICLCAFLFSF